MTGHEHLAAAIVARDRLATARDETTAALGAFYDEIKAAAAGGVPITTIAKAVGLSRFRVHQIIGDRRT